MTVLYFLAALLVLSIVVVAHEFGHYASARLMGIDVLEFSVGMGPRLWSKQGKHTLFSLKAFPIGGSCRYIGEDDGDFQSPGALNNQPRWKRFITIASGPLMNFVLAVLVAALYFMLMGTPSTRPLIAELTPGYPAEAQGILVGDVIESINGEAIPFTEAGANRAVELIRASGSEGVQVGLLRGEARTEVALVPKQDSEDANVRLIGIVLGQERQRVGAFDALRGAWGYCSLVTRSMLDFLRGLFTTGAGLDETAGPVGMIDIMTKQISGGWDEIFNLIVLISLNLGIMNLLPLPALDGGRLVFIAIESIIRRPIKPELEGWVHAAGFLLLMGFILFITYKDIVRLIWKA